MSGISKLKVRVKNVIKKLKNKKTVLFVCTGNTCRSPIAEKVFENYLASKSLLGRYSVESAGLSVTEDSINVLAKEALHQNKIKCGGHIPRQLDIVSVTGAYRVICMEQIHKDMIERAVGELEHIKTVDEITGKGNIPDPYGTNFNKYLETVQIISGMCEDLLFDLEMKVEEEIIQPKKTEEAIQSKNGEDVVQPEKKKEKVKQIRQQKISKAKNKEAVAKTTENTESEPTENQVDVATIKDEATPDFGVNLQNSEIFDSEIFDKDSKLEREVYTDTAQNEAKTATEQTE